MHTLTQAFGAAVLLTAIAFGAAEVDDEDAVEASAASAPVVRKAQRAEEEAAPGQWHCVAWGDVVPTGLKFRRKGDAEATFQKMKQTQMVTAHYKGLIEVERHLSPRLASVTWRRLRDWCAKAPDVEEPGNPSFVRLTEEPKFDELAQERPPREEEPKFNWKSKFDELVQEQPPRVEARIRSPKRKRFLRNTEPVPLDDEDHDSHHYEYSGHHHVRYSLLHKGRQHGTPSFLDDHASTTVGKKAGLGGKVDAVDNEVARLASEVAELSKRVGVQQDQRASSALELSILDGETSRKPAMLKERMKKVEERLSDVHAAASSLERELLGRSSTLPTSSPRGLKAKVESLEGKANKMKSRVSALAKGATAVGGQLEHLEENLGRLSSKAATMLRNVGHAGDDEEPRERDGDASFVDRLHGIDGDSEKLQLSIESLEEELRGSKASAPPKRKGAQHLSEKVKLLEARVKSMGGRLTSLEQEI